MSYACVRCGKTGLGNDEISMSEDGWLCDPCFKAWDRAVAAKAPKPWLESEKIKLSLDALPEMDEAGFVAAKRMRALRWMALGAGLIVIGCAGTAWLLGWLELGGVIPTVIGGAPLVAIIGAILLVWSALDWIRAR
jgi:hypothetical protein